MDKLTVVLQDRTTIENLVKDPDVQIRVKNAVIDQLGKRALKLSNVTDDILAEAKKNLNEEFLVSKSYYKELKKEYKKKIRQEARIAFGDMVREELDLMKSEIRMALMDKKAEMLEQINNINLETIIIEVAEEVIKQKLGK